MKPSNESKSGPVSIVSLDCQRTRNESFLDANLVNKQKRGLMRGVCGSKRKLSYSATFAILGAGGAVGHAVGEGRFGTGGPDGRSVVKIYIKSQSTTAADSAHPTFMLHLSNLTHLPRHEFVPGIGMGVAKCPYDPADNSTALWVERGNPGSLPALYSGTNAEFTKADTVIFRTDLHNLTTGRREFSTTQKPNFVGSFDVGEYVLFFFRETAVEYINCGKAVYSRVARVCKRDTGGKNILSQNWATYLKARLNCSIPGEFPFYFNEILFTTASTGLMGSAICTFTIGDVQKAFEGKFKEQATSSSAWLPVISSKVPEPRPGTCVNDTASLPDTVLNFISAVSHENEKPIYYKRDLFFTRLVVDKVKVDMLGHQMDYTVYYAGTMAFQRNLSVKVFGLKLVEQRNIRIKITKQNN
ncbi:putative semaphorin 2a [Operophtera brumata]|uniref:Semaphorin-2A n=1 Tax=Operophtera brumata TaxID=104452 RepID=A0A0L7LLX2_OPEBR|nr:putative semaphorin 2a [Operophtera brumata]